MEEKKYINAMYNKFNDIVLNLKGHGKTIEKAELNRKLLLSLPKKMEAQGDRKLRKQKTLPP